MQQVRGDGDEDGGRGGERVSGGISERAFGVMASTCGAGVAGGENEWLTERDGTQVLDVEGAGHGDDAASAIGLAHGFVEEGGNDASMGVTWRTGETGSEAETADDVLVGVGEEAKAQARGVVESAAEAVIQGAVSEGLQE